MVDTLADNGGAVVVLHVGGNLLGSGDDGDGGDPPPQLNLFY